MNDGSATSTNFDFKVRIGDKRDFIFKKYFNYGDTELTDTYIDENGSEQTYTIKAGVQLTVEITARNESRGWYLGFFPDAPELYGRLNINDQTIAEDRVSDLYVMPVTDNISLWEEWVKQYSYEDATSYRHIEVNDKKIVRESKNTHDFARIEWEKATGWLIKQSISSKDDDGSIQYNYEIEVYTPSAFPLLRQFHAFFFYFAMGGLFFFMGSFLAWRYEKTKNKQSQNNQKNEKKAF